MYCALFSGDFIVKRFTAAIIIVMDWASVLSLSSKFNIQSKVLETAPRVVFHKELNTGRS
jgi:hypothetical protein